MVDKSEPSPDLIVATKATPDFDDLSFVEGLRLRGKRIPVMLLTERYEELRLGELAYDGGLMLVSRGADTESLLSSVSRLLHRNAVATPITSADETRARWDTLTPREREVFTHVATGQANKQTAAMLGTTVKTVKVHRSRALAKMHAASVAAVVRIVDRLVDLGLIDWRKLPPLSPRPRSSRGGNGAGVDPSTTRQRPQADRVVE